MTVLIVTRSYIQQKQVDLLFYFLAVKLEVKSFQWPEELCIRVLVCKITSIAKHLWALGYWESSLARTREVVAKPRGAPSIVRSREACFAHPNRRACSQAKWLPSVVLWSHGSPRAVILSFEAAKVNEDSRITTLKIEILSSGRKEGHFYSLPFRQAEAGIY